MKNADIAKSRLLNQQLLSPLFDDPAELVAWMGAMQAQDFAMSLLAVELRLRTPSHEAVLKALGQGRIIRTHLNRATWQLVSREDTGWMIPLHRERSVRAWRSFSKQSGRLISDTMMDESRELLREALSGGACLARETLLPEYARALGITDAYTARHLLAVAEAEGIIYSGPSPDNKVSYVLADSKDPEPEIPREEALSRLAGRYFQSHAPATLEDFVWWSGLAVSECRAGMQRIAASLHEEKAGGRTCYVHEKNRQGRLPKGFTRLLPPYDELLIGYKDRTAVLPPEHRGKAHNNSGIFYPVVLRGSSLVGNWSRKDKSIRFWE